MLFASVYALARLLVAILLLRAQAEAERDLELLALRHEVAVLRRHGKRPELLPTDRLLLAALGRRLPAGRLLFTPATVLRWHRELVRRRWAAFGRPPRRGRPPIPEEVRSLIVRLAREMVASNCTSNSTSWGSMDTGRACDQPAAGFFDFVGEHDAISTARSPAS